MVNHKLTRAMQPEHVFRWAYGLDENTLTEWILCQYKIRHVIKPQHAYIHNNNLGNHSQQLVIITQDIFYNNDGIFFTWD